MKRLYLLLLLLFLVQSCATGFTNSGSSITDEGTIWLAKVKVKADDGLRRNLLKLEEIEPLNIAAKRLLQLVTYDEQLFIKTYTETNEYIQQYLNIEVLSIYEEFRKELPGIIKELNDNYLIASQETQRMAIQSQQMAIQMNQLTQQLNQVGATFNNSVPVYQPNFNYTPLSPPGTYFGPQSTTNFLINTDYGLQQTRCITLSNGTVYCN